MLHYSVCLGPLNALRILIMKIMSFSRPSFSCSPVILFNPHLRMPYCTYSLLCSTPVYCISTTLTFSTSFTLSLYHFLQLCISPYVFAHFSVFLHYLCISAFLQMYILRDVFRFSLLSSLTVYLHLQIKA